MRVPQLVRSSALLAIAAALVSTAFLTRGYWQPLLQTQTEPSVTEEGGTPVEEPKVVKLSPQGRKNLGLVARPVELQTYWRTIQVPGSIVDRPGRSDRGVTAPAVGAVTQIHAFPGDTVRVGERLFTLSLFSEYLQSTQKDLFTATRETEFIQGELVRLRPLAERGTVPNSQIIDLENQLRRQGAVIQAHRQDLLTRGLNPNQIESVAEGIFVSTVEVVAPPLESPPAGSGDSDQVRSLGLPSDSSRDFAYEVQELHAELGQQVQAGQLLATLANHSSLYIEGHAFKRDARFLEAAAQNGWEITVEFAEDDPQNWPPLEQTFEIRHLSNVIDTTSRTFDFYISLHNQSRSYTREDKTFIVWRFRPGQRVRLHVPVEQMDNVLVVPAAAVVREGPEAYVFQQNGDLFNRLPVHVIHEDRLNVVIANDGSIAPGFYLAQSEAASLNRALKAQASSGMRADVHVHADGTVHSSH